MSDPGTLAADRYVYEEFTLGSQTVAMIETLDNERAWIQSTVSVPVER